MNVYGIPIALKKYPNLIRRGEKFRLIFFSLSDTQVPYLRAGPRSRSWLQIFMGGAEETDNC